MSAGACPGGGAGTGRERLPGDPGEWDSHQRSKLQRTSRLRVQAWEPNYWIWTLDFPT